MRRPRLIGVLATALVALPVASVGAVLRAGPSHAAAPGMIVFASDRDKFNPGEIYSLALGSAPRDVSRSLAGDYGLAVAPVGDRIAFWSGRTGTDRVYLARSDGSQLRLVRTTREELSSTTPGSGGALVFSSDGARLYARSYSTPGAFLVDTRRATARPIAGCGGITRPSPDLALVACGLNGKTTVSDLAGRVRFTLPGLNALWSSRGWLTSARPAAETSRTPRTAVVVEASGAIRARIAGQPLGWTPDGRRLVFQRGQSLRVAGPGDLGRSRLLLRRWPGGPLSFTPDSRALLTEGAAGVSVLIALAGGRVEERRGTGLGVWSRDGRLAYADYAAAYRNGTHAGVELPVLVTDTHGRNPRVVGRVPFDDHNYSELQWLPDGRRVLFLTGSSCGGSGLFAVPASGGATRPLGRDPRSLEEPAWSPDGSRIAVSVQTFTCHLGAGLPVRIASLAADGSNLRPVTDEGDPQKGSFDRFPSFSPDGRRVVFAHGTLDSSSLQIADAGGGAGRTALDSVSAEPAWSPDGRLIAYAEGRSLKAVSPSGGAPEVIARGLPLATCGTGGLAWSPDGREIAIGRGAGIYLITVGKPASARLAIRARCAGHPSFSPDGTQIAFDAQPVHPLGHQSAIMVARTDGSDLRTLSTVPFRESVHPTWQPAG
jgi:Tol biopolymer transport system component